jgi:acetolactate synthase-1/2/3 large subunit
VACPGRSVINIEGDGSGMYTLQSLWTQAREQLNVTTIICSNRIYKILAIEVHRAGVSQPGPSTKRLAELSSPALDWVHLAKGMGVPAVAVDTADALVREIERALAEPGPHLIEAIL